MQCSPDFYLSDHGSIVLLTPHSLAAEEWCTEYLPEDCPMWSENSYVIERRYIADILTGIDMEGMTYA